MPIINNFKKIKNDKIKLLTLITLLILLIAAPQSVPYQNPYEVKLPTQWYLLPEEKIASSEHSESEDTDENIKKIKGNFTNLLNIQKILFNELPEDNYLTTHRKRKWHFSGINTNFSINAEGKLGLLIMGGGRSISALWAKGPLPQFIDKSLMTYQKEVSAKIPQEAQGEIEGIPLNGHESLEELKKELEAPIEAILKTNVVKKEKQEQFKRNFLSAAQNFQLLIEAIESIENGFHAHWGIARLILIFNVDINGVVFPSIPAQVGVEGVGKVSFEWRRLKSQKEVPPHMASEIKKTNDRLAKTPLYKYLRFFCSVLSDLSEIPDKFFKKQRFRFYGTQMYFGLSGTLSLVGLLNAQAGITGSIFFKKNLIPRPSPILPPVALPLEDAHHLMTVISDSTKRLWMHFPIDYYENNSDELPLFSLYNEDHVQYAQKENISYEEENIELYPHPQENLSAQNTSSLIMPMAYAAADENQKLKVPKKPRAIHYHVPRDVFKRELIKALKIANTFASSELLVDGAETEFYPAGRNNSWYLANMIFSYNLSLGGTIGLVKLSQSNTIEFRFRKEKD